MQGEGGPVEVDVVGVRRVQQRAVEAVGPRVVRAAQRLRRARRDRGARLHGDDLRPSVAAHVVVGVQGALGIGRDEHRLAVKVDHGETLGHQVAPARHRESEVVEPADAGPLGEQHDAALALVQRGVDVVLPGERLLQAAHVPAFFPPIRARRSFHSARLRSASSWCTDVPAWDARHAPAAVRARSRLVETGDRRTEVGVPGGRASRGTSAPSSARRGRCCRPRGRTRSRCPTVRAPVGAAPTT